MNLVLDDVKETLRGTLSSTLPCLPCYLWPIYPHHHDGTDKT